MKRVLVQPYSVGDGFKLSLTDLYFRHNYILVLNVNLC